MRGAHAARALALVSIVCCSGLAAAGQAVPGDSATPGSDLPAKTSLTVEADTAALAELGTARMPGGMASLCKRDPSVCDIAAAPGHELQITPERWELLSRVNTSVNRRITSTTDEQLYGREEYWTIPTKAGDCEDYVLLKRQTLQRMGLPVSSLLITVVHDENGAGHAVLTVPAGGGDLVLDNRRDQILRWWQTGYAFIKRQSEADPRKWVSLGEEALQTTNIASGPETP